MPTPFVPRTQGHRPYCGPDTGSWAAWELRTNRQLEHVALSPKGRQSPLGGQDLERELPSVLGPLLLLQLTAVAQDLGCTRESRHTPGLLGGSEGGCVAGASSRWEPSSGRILLPSVTGKLLADFLLWTPFFHLPSCPPTHLPLLSAPCCLTPSSPEPLHLASC